MRFELVESTDDLRALEPEWRALCDRVPGHTIFQTFDWNRSAWEGSWRARGVRLCVVVGRERSRMAVILPLVVERQACWHIARALSAVVCSYDDAVVEPVPEARAWLDRALDSAAARHRIDLFSFSGVRRDAALFPVLEADRRSNRTRLASAAIQWQDWPDWDSYKRSLGRGFVSDTARQRRRLAAIGDVRFEVVGTASDAAETLGWLVEQKRRWLVRNRLPTRRFDAERGFLEALVAYALPQGALCLAWLKCGNEIVAAELGVLHDGTHSVLVTTYDRRWHSYSPGRLMYGATIRWSFRNGLRVYDLNNGEHAYKAEWARHRVPMTEFLSPNSRLGASVAAWRRSSFREIVRRSYHLLPDQVRARIQDSLTT